MTGPTDLELGGEPREVTLRELEVGQTGVMFVARIVTLRRREVARTDGTGKRPLVSGLLSDGTAVVPFTWWDPPGEEIERGLVLRVVDPRLGEHRGRLEVSITRRTRVAPASEAELPNGAAAELPLRRVAELRAGDQAFAVVVRVASVSPKAIVVAGVPRVVHEGRLADNSGSIRFTSWAELPLRVDAAVRVTGASARAFRGRTELVLDDGTEVVPARSAELPSSRELAAPVEATVAHLEATGGGANVRATGIVVGLVSPSGLVHRCPECRRRLADGHCRLHGAVAGEPDLRARLVLDDGTGAMTVELGRAETEHATGVTLESCLGEGSTPETVEDRVFDSTFGRRFTVVGEATSDDFGVTLRPVEIVPVAAAPDRALASLRRRLGGARA